jgi:phospholipid/cholesterol/gamma-HCH transport system substrate-binding protein
MRNQTFETLIGLAVLIVGVGFLYFAIGRTNVGAVDGYTLTAEFARIDGIGSGSDVRISGVKVGSVNGLTLDPQSFLAVVSLTVRNDIALPSDTLAKIESEGLLGGQYLALEPGADEAFLADGDQLTYTQSSPSLSELLSQAVFSSNDK